LLPLLDIVERSGGPAMTWQEQYQQPDGRAAELFEREIVPRITSLWATDLVDRACVRIGDNVLDVACGTGVVTRLAAQRCGRGRVVGLDLNADMLRVACGIGHADGAPIEWCEGSALALPFEDGTFNVVLCQLGLQFFPDKSLALHEMARVLTFGGRLLLSVFTPIERTPIAYAFANALDRHLGEGASFAKRAEHSFSDSDLLAQLATHAGLKNVVVVPVTQTIRFPSAVEYVRLQLTATPQARLLSKMMVQERDAKIQAIAQDLASAMNSVGPTDEISSAQECNVLMAPR
jgi:ubiquinone/menaquinone biosynthesis C-methylase UbiE